MRCFLITVILLLFNTHLFAQQAHWSSAEIVLQTRVLHHFQAGNQESFNIKSDAGIGMRWVATLSPALQLSIGAQLNHGIYEKREQAENTLYYIDFFKSQAYHYFNLIDVSQWTAEIPLSIRKSFFNLGKSKIGCYASGSPQLLLYSTGTGLGLDGEESRYNSISSGNLPLDNLPAETKLVSDFFLGTGAFLSREILSNRSLFFEAGYEYSTAGKSSGLVIKMGIGF